jgi:hypothetical protein
VPAVLPRHRSINRREAPRARHSRNLFAGRSAVKVGCLGAAKSDVNDVIGRPLCPGCARTAALDQDQVCQPLPGRGRLRPKRRTWLAGPAVRFTPGEAAPAAGGARLQRRAPRHARPSPPKNRRGTRGPAAIARQVSRAALVSRSQRRCRVPWGLYLRHEATWRPGHGTARNRALAGTHEPVQPLHLP